MLYVWYWLLSQSLLLMLLTSYNLKVDQLGWKYIMLYYVKPVINELYIYS